MAQELSVLQYAGIVFAFVFVLFVLELQKKKKVKGKFHKHSTAKEVVDAFGTGKYLVGKTAVVTGGILLE